MQNLFAQFATGFPDDLGQALLITPAGHSFSYADAERESARLANYLAASGLRIGDRVTVQAPKSPQAVWLYLACLRGGFVYHPLNQAYQSAELDYLVADAKPSLVVCTPEHVPLFSNLTREQRCRVVSMDESGGGSLTDESQNASATFDTVTCDANTVAVLLYSSGTTGKPKGAMLTHRNLAANTRTLINAWGFTATDRLLHALPIYHAHGLFVAMGCVFMSGASMIFLPKFDVQTVIRHLPDATVLMGIPTFYTRLLNEKKFSRECCASIRLFISGSAPLLADTHREFAARTGHAIVERYGMTETCMNSSNPLDGERRPGSVGPALPGVTIRITDDADCPVPAGQTGEIQVRGPNVFVGYWGMPEMTAHEFTDDGFFRTGDLGILSDDGYVSIRGRKKDMIISGGLNVYPREVEQVLDELQCVAESAVVGVPHPDFGEGIIAVVVPQPGQSTTEEHVIASVRAKLADFKAPKRVFFVEQLPRNAMGKVRKNALREQYNGVLS
jgi:malonyl-CoA/methylmalonyl-CoA synthetase